MENSVDAFLVALLGVLVETGSFPLVLISILVGLIIGMVLGTLATVTIIKSTK